MSLYPDKEPFPNDEEDSNESQVSGMEFEAAPAMLTMATRKHSTTSTDSRISELSSRGRRISTMVNQVVQIERCRRPSRATSTYQSPYSKLKTMQDSMAPVPIAKEANKQSGIPLENTYRMKPKSHFPVDAIRQIIIKTLKNGLGDEDYYKINPARVCRALSQHIKDQVKSLDIDRFRIVCLVTIGAKFGQEVRVASRCLWDAQFDRFASASVENGTLFAVGTVYGVYFE